MGNVFGVFFVCVGVGGFEFFVLFFDVECVFLLYWNFCMILFLKICWFGCQFYEVIWKVMSVFIDNCIVDIFDELWLFEYDLVFIQGQVGKVEYVLVLGDILVVQVDCGGQVIYYGFGQIVGYLLIDLCCVGVGVCELVYCIEQILIDMLVYWNIVVEWVEGVFGVYVVGVKVVVLGLCVCCGCSFYGLVFNVVMDLELYYCINFCGYKGLVVMQVLDLGGLL